jgi:hypothetical protein
MASTLAVDGTASEPPRVPSIPSMPLPTKTESAFSKVLLSPGTQHVSLASTHIWSVHWQDPKASHE